MTGSPCDGEDVLQDAMVLAFYRLSELREGGSLRAWLFRVAHNKCIDFLRRRRRFDQIVSKGEGDDGREERTMDDELDHKARAERALSNIVTKLPPKERACVVLRDVLDCSLEEAAEITGSNVGAVKAALHRGREKLEHAGHALESRAALEPGDRALVERYLAAFNRRDWGAVQALLSEEARLEVVERSEGPFAEARYFINYGLLPCVWKLALAWVDGVESVVQFRWIDGVWVPHTVVQLSVEGGQITLVRDYTHVDYLLRHCAVTPPPE
jgi:RNA polymerase sigma-70 factor (ECF subfamily)